MDAQPIQPSHTTWWVWWDALLEEWFYSSEALSTTPALAAQLQLEKTRIHEVNAQTGVQAVEQVCPGYRAVRREDPITRPASLPSIRH